MRKRVNGLLAISPSSEAVYRAGVALELGTDAWLGAADFSLVQAGGALGPYNDRTSWENLEPCGCQKLAFTFARR
jgi:hypothetical protein